MRAVGLFLLSLASGCILATDAAYVQWKYCEGSPIGDFTPASSRAQLVSSGLYTRLDMMVTVDSRGTASCTQLLDGSNDVILDVDMLGSSAEYRISAQRTCLPPVGNDDPSQRPLARYAELRFNISQELNLVGPLRTFSTDLYLGPNKSNPIACMSSEITPQLHQDISSALRYVPLAIFLVVFISALLTTLYTSSPTPNPEQEESQSEAPSPMKAILPGVGDCLQHLQFIFLAGSLTLHYPGFYQPVVSYFSWASLFSPIGPVTHGRTYPSVSDGIYETNGTLTGLSGLELMAQVTGGPMSMDIWLNMVILVLVIVAGTALLVAILRAMPCMGFSSISQPPAIRQSPIKQITRDVLNVILGYFVTPIVAISAYQLNNHPLSSYHLALATLLIVLLLFSFAWMAWTLPPRQLGVLLLDGSKRYGHLGSDHGPESRDRFVLIFLIMAFVRGAIMGGLQIFPLMQITLLTASELCLSVSAMVLRPYRSLFSVFTICCFARLVVIALNYAFLPISNASISTRSLVGYIILVLHAAVLALGCFIPALYRLGQLAFTRSGANDGPEVYGISQLRRRSTVINDLSSTPYDNGTNNQSGVTSPACINGSPSGLISGGASSTNVPEISQYYRPRRLRASSSHFDSLLNLAPLIPTSPNSDSLPMSTVTSPKSAVEPEISQRPISTTLNANSANNILVLSPSPPSSTSLKPLAPLRPDYTFREADLYYGRPQSADALDDEANDPLQTSVPWSSFGLYVAGAWERLMGWKEKEPKQGDGFQVIWPQRGNVGSGSIPSTLLQGTSMTKVTKKQKKLLTFVLNNEDAKVSWDNNRPSKSFYIDDIKDIRVGADARNYRQEFGVSIADEPRFFSIVYAVPDKSKGRSQKVMHLIANDEQTLNLWTTTLNAILKHRQDLMVSLSSSHDEAIITYWRSEMNKRFQDKPHSEDQEQIDIVGVERLCRSLHIYSSSNYLRSRFNQADVSQSGRLNFAQFQEFVKLIKRQDVQVLYRELASDSEKGITLEEFFRFLKDVQDEDVEANRAHWEGVFAKSIHRSKSTEQAQQDALDGEISRMNEFALASYLISTFNCPLDNPPAQYSLDRPLNEYFISSSHNTYLLGRQVAGQSSVEAYISALNRGCRCVEVDCWNGSDGPVVMHGRTLTSQVSFADVMATISKYAFIKSPYPLWVSLEVHCNPTQQAMMAEIIKETCGSKLVTGPVDPSSEQLPTPSQLMNRILVKVKKADMLEDPMTKPSTGENGGSSLSSAYIGPTQVDNSTVLAGSLKYSDSESQDSLSSNTSDRESLTEDIAKAKENHQKNKTSNIIKVLGELGVYSAGLKFRGFDTPDSKAYNHVFSFRENTFDKSIKTQEDKLAIIRHNMRYMMRVYPNGWRVASTNFDPLKYWRHGVQMVALNWQTYDLGMQMNNAMFASGTDQSGYVLKPSELREIKMIPNVPEEAGIGHIKRERKNVNFSIDLISASQLMRPKDLAPTRSFDSYIEVEVYHADDKTKEKGVIGEGGLDGSAKDGSSGLGAPHRRRTHIVLDNGNPIFDKKFQFTLTTKYTDLIFVRWTVRCSSDGHNYSDRGAPLATYTAKLSSLKQGYRTLPLYDSNGEQFHFSTLFCRIKIEPVTSLYVNGPKASESVSVFKTIGRTVWNRTQILTESSVDSVHQ